MGSEYRQLRDSEPIDTRGVAGAGCVVGEVFRTARPGTWKARIRPLGELAAATNLIGFASDHTRHSVDADQDRLACLILGLAHVPTGAFFCRQRNRTGTRPMPRIALSNVG